VMRGQHRRVGLRSMRATSYETTGMSAVKRCAIALLAVFAASASAHAGRPPHPWCMVFQDRSGVWACVFDSFEQCREEARPGNMGFCTSNPFYQTSPPMHARPTQRRRKRSR